MNGIGITVTDREHILEETIPFGPELPPNLVFERFSDNPGDVLAVSDDGCLYVKFADG